MSCLMYNNLYGCIKYLSSFVLITKESQIFETNNNNIFILNLVIMGGVIFELLCIHAKKILQFSLPKIFKTFVQLLLYDSQKIK